MARETEGFGVAAEQIGLARSEVMARPLKVPSLIDALYDALRADIYVGRLQAGQPVTEKSVALAFGVARPSAKAAIERLATDGLLRRGANKSARVPRLTAADVYDLYRSRMVMERAVVSHLARADNLPRAAWDAHAAFGKGLDNGDVLEVVEADLSLHSALLAAMESPRLSRMYSLLLGEVRLCMAQVQERHLVSREAIHAEHTAILESISMGDECRAITEVQAHIEAARDLLVAGLEDRDAALNEE